MFCLQGIGGGFFVALVPRLLQGWERVELLEV